VIGLALSNAAMGATQASNEDSNCTVATTRESAVTLTLLYEFEKAMIVCAAQAEEIPPIRAEIATARIQTLNPAGVANDPAIRGDRQDTIGPAI
jgi:hypothetical protein